VKKFAVVVAVVLVALLVWFVVRPGPEPSAATASARAEPTATATSNEARAPLELEHGGAPPAEVANTREAVATKSARQPLEAIVRLVDERTDEPVPFFALEIVDARHERVPATTDAEGRVELADAIDTTLYFAENLRAIDRIQTRRDCLPTLVQSVELAAAEFGQGVRDVRAPVGPTYRLRVAPPAGLALADLTATLRPADPRQAFDSAFADVRDGAPPWVRFRASARCLGGGPPWRLELATRDGLWYGAAEVPSNEGVQREVVAIEFAPRARLFGTVLDDAGDVQGGFVRIEREGASFASADNRPLFGLLAEDGKYAIRCAPAGRYTARFHAENHRDFEREIDLAEGEARELAIVVARIPRNELVQLEGSVESTTGSFRGSLDAYLTPDAQDLSPRRAQVSWGVVGGRWVGAFAFEVPPVGYSVRINGADLIAVEPQEQHWSAGSPALHFVVRDAQAVGRLEFRAVDPRGAALLDFSVQLTARGEVASRSTQAAAVDGVARVESLPLARPIEYRAFAAGRRSAWGECTLTDDAAKAVVVELAQGWSCEVQVTDDAAGALAGVRVSFDDKLAGVTDEHGVLRASLAQTPTSARFELDGWTAVDASDYSAATGRFRSWLPWLTLSMRRTR